MQRRHIAAFGHKTSLYDASAITATPTVSPATGTFALSLSTPQETQAQCLTQSGQQAAWSCDLAGNPAVVLGVDLVPNTDHVGAWIFYGSNDTQISYGTQVSAMNTQLSQFLAVMDNDAPGNGPAFYFQQYYNKLVVVPENALKISSGKLKPRQGYYNLAQGWLQQKSVAAAGDQPWFCFWNNTFLEGFVYVQQPLAQTSLNTTLSASAAEATNSTSPSSATAVSASPTPTESQPAPHGPPAQPLVTTFSNPATTATYSGPPAQYPSWSASMDHSSNHNKRQSPTAPDADTDFWDTLSLYPYIVKLEERRLTGNTVQPYCQQMQILDDGSAGLAPTANGAPNVIQLAEQDPAYAAYQSAGLAGNGRRDEGFMARRMVQGGCHCQWMSGQS